jgi:hypothetical protein
MKEKFHQTFDESQGRILGFSPPGSGFDARIKNISEKSGKTAIFLDLDNAYSQAQPDLANFALQRLNDAIERAKVDPSNVLVVVNPGPFQLDGGFANRFFEAAKEIPATLIVRTTSPREGAIDFSNQRLGSSLFGGINPTQEKLSGSLFGRFTTLKEERHQVKAP